jgi:ATP-dependent DNA helicase RecG
VQTHPLTQSVQFLKGIGPRRAEALEKIGIKTVYDLLFHVPRRYLDRSMVVSISDLRKLARGLNPPRSAHAPELNVSRDYTVVGEVRSFQVIGYRSKARFVLVLGDETGSMQCVWFGGVKYWKTRFTVGETIAVSGEPSYFGSVLQFVHPAVDRISMSPPNGDGEEEERDAVDWTKALHTGGMIPLYPSTSELERVGLDSAGFRRVIRSSLNTSLALLRDPLPLELLQKHQLMACGNAIQTVHVPRNTGEVARALHRLKYDELFFFQLKLAMKRRQAKEESVGVQFNVRSGLARKLVDALPFRLTPAQIRVIKEITADMESAKPMNRLLQGDVGSGKTIVALIAMLIAVENGYQAAFLAPTEILAEQHYKTLQAFTMNLDVNIRLLIGGQRSKLRRDVLEDARQGSAQIVVGTHAVLEKNVQFAKLGFVVIDEQHRFGVMQRASIRQKGENPDVLVMTATPIPRTLSLTLYGDLDISVIDELPKDRKPVKTLLRYEEDKQAVFEFLRSQVKEGRQAYIVYPLIEESEKLDLKAATVHFEQLKRDVFPDLRLGLIHGRLPSEEKDAVMSQLKSGKLDVLVATTVIEVGIDVPNASVMLIENAERFGLSQLHQLRGRVGRGAEQSYCVLLAKRWIARRAERQAFDSTREGPDEQRLAERRLATMVATTDGFKIAEVDLELRGPGDFFGTRQSGLPEFKVANIVSDAPILTAARADAFGIVQNDPQLLRPEHRPLLNHLHTFHREALALLHVG